MRKLDIEKLHPDFGARITGINLTKELPEEVVDALQQVIDTYSLLHFPDQGLNDEQQLAFTRLLGNPEPSHVKLGQEGIVDYFITIGNVQDDGSVIGNDHKKTRFLTGNNMWHSDSSFRETPTYVSIVSADEVPTEGGETKFISARAAYGRLPEEIRTLIDPLVVIHDYTFSRSKVGSDLVTHSHAESLPPVRQKLVRTNPGNGEKNFYAGSHAKEIEGWSYNDSRAILDGLVNQAEQEAYIYSHMWQPADLIIWDNRCLLHRGNGYDADKYRRRMRQTRVMGASSTIVEDSIKL